MSYFNQSQSDYHVVGHFRTQKKQKTSIQYTKDFVQFIKENICSNLYVFLLLFYRHIFKEYVTLWTPRNRPHIWGESIE
jgi:hypothetical protein